MLGLWVMLAAAAASLVRPVRMQIKAAGTLSRLSPSVTA